MNNLDKILLMALVVFAGAVPVGAGGLPDARIVFDETNYDYHAVPPQMHVETQSQVIYQDQMLPSAVMSNYSQPPATLPPGNWVPCNDNPADLCEYQIIGGMGANAHANYGYQQGAGQFQGAARAYAQPGFVQERVDIYSEPLYSPHQQPGPSGVYGGHGQPYHPGAGAYAHGQVAPRFAPYANAY